MKKIKKSLKNYLKYVKPWTMCLVAVGLWLPVLTNLDGRSWIYCFMFKVTIQGAQKLVLD